MIGEIFLSIYVDNMKLVYLSVRSSSWRGWDWVKESDGGNRYFSLLQVLEKIKIWCKIQVMIYPLEFLPIDNTYNSQTLHKYL